ncbi:MAG: hypothetical protein IH863_02080 [Chloroflexi bacterium]|nr:hypothetical protein [Chloroflexota bacterium]
MLDVAFGPDEDQRLDLYLPNDPSPPTGDTASHLVLPMDFSPPTSTVLYNYDTDRDDFPGRVIQKGSGGFTPANEANKMQVWRTPPLASALTMPHGVRLDLWSAMKDFKPGKTGSIRASLIDYDGAAATIIGSAILTDSDWQDGSTGWVLKSLTIQVSPASVSAGHSLGLLIEVPGSSSDDDMWIAYDHSTFASRIAQAK